MAEYRPAVGRNEVLAVVQLDRRGLGFRVDAPFVGEPASVENVSADKHNGRDQHDCECVHGFSSLFRLDLRRFRQNQGVQSIKKALVFTCSTQMG